jgi:chromate transporter
LFWAFVQVGLFSIGGGLAALPLIQDQVVDVHGWLTLTEFTDIITIAEMTPGPVALNTATFVGIRTAGIPGALLATFSCILPSCFIVILLAKLYYKYRGLSAMRYIFSGLRPAVVAMIASAGMSIIFLAFFGGNLLPASIDGVSFISVGIFIVSIFILRKWKMNPIYVMLGAGVVGLAIYSLI